MENVFVYGILLRRYPGSPKGHPARLRDWRLAFDAGLATVLPAPGEYVEGALLEVTREELRSYDCTEGINRTRPEHGLYRRVRTVVQLPHEPDVFAWVYIKNSSDDPWAPGFGMLASIHAGYEAWRLDVDKLEEAVERARAVAA